MITIKGFKTTLRHLSHYPKGRQYFYVFTPHKRFKRNSSLISAFADVIVYIRQAYPRLKLDNLDLLDDEITFAIPKLTDEEKKLFKKLEADYEEADKKKNREYILGLQDSIEAAGFKLVE